MRVTLTAIAISVLLIVHHTAEAYDRRIMLCLVNKERVNRGLPPLGPNAALDRAAQRHSDDQAKFKFMEHDGTDGSNPGTRIEEAGYKWEAYRENIAFGQKDEHEVMEEWMNSSGHRKNILYAKVIHLGSAVAYNGDVPYYTQNFGHDGSKGGLYPPSKPSYADVVKAPAPAPAPKAPETSDYSSYSYSPAPSPPSSYGSDDDNKKDDDSDNSYSSSYSSSSYSSSSSSSNSSKGSSKHSSGYSTNSYSSSEPSSDDSESRPTEWTCTKKKSDGTCCRWKKCTGNSKSWKCRERWGSF
ncbi:CAP domain-containing protein [Syncephalis plumigaleata]|nr:CAP domain-containing protein [Syncephalis plumigaleata]